MSDHAERLRFTVKEPVEAELLVKTPSGTRPPTDEDLLACRLKSDVLLKSRRYEIMQALFGSAYENDDTPECASGIRYLLEYATEYAHLELPDEALEALRGLIQRAGGGKS